MKSRVTCGLTAGVAVVSAGVMAVTPVAPMSEALQKSVEARVALMANFTGMNQVQLAQLTGKRLFEQALQAPFVPLVIALQAAGGDPDRTYSAIKQVIDSPVYVADPAIEALANTLPASFGGGSDHVTNTTAGDGGVMQFRNERLLGLRDALDAAVAQALGVPGSRTDENYAFELATGMMASAQRTTTGAVLAVAGLPAIAQAIASGDKVDLYNAIRQYTDAPLWAADPAIVGLAQALPPSLGGGVGPNPTTDNTGDGGLLVFRNTQLWVATKNVRVAIAGMLGVPVDSSGNVVEPQTSLMALRPAQAEPGDSSNSDVPDVQLPSKPAPTVQQTGAADLKQVSDPTKVDKQAVKQQKAAERQAAKDKKAAERQAAKDAREAARQAAKEKRAAEKAAKEQAKEQAKAARQAAKHAGADAKA